MSQTCAQGGLQKVPTALVQFLDGKALVNGRKRELIAGEGSSLRIQLALQSMYLVLGSIYQVTSSPKSSHSFLTLM
jgi:hypothetical protein